MQVCRQRSHLDSLSRPLLLVVAIGTALSGCDKSPQPNVAAPTKASGALAESTATESAGEPAEGLAPAPAPNGATAGDVLRPLPAPAPKLFDGKTTASLMPEVACEELVPEKGYQLAKKIDVISRGTKKGEGDRTLELCMFNQWVQRTDPELSQRTGRKHHFVAAFPGATAASWTSRELQRADLGLSEQGGSGLAAGWAALIATGVPQWPAVAVLSGRFYNGAKGEEVHYMRRGRALVQRKGRWSWEPLAELTFATLDTQWLTRQCAEAAEDDTACAAAATRIAQHMTARKARLAQRKRRLAGEPDTTKTKSKRAKRAKTPKNPRTYRDDADPQAAWLRDARWALAANKPTFAVRAALRAIVACGELSKETDAVLRKATKLGKWRATRVQPVSKKHDLCAPLPDKPPPKDRK